ncbi:MAG: adenylyl-sulfate kinase [Acidimicrobiales bacterium]
MFRNGELPKFTGIDSPYEPPEDPEVRIDTTSLSPHQGASLVIDYLEASFSDLPVAGTR